MSGDGDATGGMTGDGDATGGMTGDGDATGGTTGDGDTSFDIGTVMIDDRTVLTNADGFVLYWFDPDFDNPMNSDGGGVSGAWPAVMVSSPTVAAGLEVTDFSNSPSGQTTYKGFALYTFASDSMPGVATGESAAWPLATTAGPPQ